MEDQLFRTTSNKSVERRGREIDWAGRLLMNGWQGIVSSLFALFGNGGETVSTQVVISCKHLTTFYAY